jgi:toxin ParE1/3/4
MTKVQIVWAEKARRDLHGIVRYLRQYSPEAAERTSKRITASIHQLAEFPLSGRAIPELPDTDFRELIVDDYRVVYEPRGDTVEILSILHSRRLMPNARQLRE